MKKNLHPKAELVKFTCFSCKSSFEILSTLKQEKVTIEVCSRCHPFYLGKNTAGKVTGKAEKLLHKFEAGKKQIDDPVKKISKKAKPKKEAKNKKTLADLL